jgi:ribosomal protein S18 acetylase RimI-like enzyme
VVGSVLYRSDPAEPGVHPFDARYHLRQVAELVGSVFADELDATGRSVLDEMRVVGRLSPLLGSLLSMALFSDFVSGYVWVADRRVVGNVTLQRADVSGARWRISNVAVAPEHRRKGVARELMLATLGEIAERGGKWAILQVRRDNPGARHLYERLGFTDVCQDGVWRLSAVPETPARRDGVGELRSLRPGGWQERLELARASRTSLAQWAEPIDPSDFQVSFLGSVQESMSNLFGLTRTERWGISKGGRLVGAVETRSRGTPPHTLAFEVHPELRGQLEEVLVARGLKSLADAAPQPVIAQHSADHAEAVAALEAAGFRPQRVLLTMRRQVLASDAEP